MSSESRQRAWQAVMSAAERLGTCDVATLFAPPEQRFAEFSREADGLLLDFTRQPLDTPALEALLGLADASDLAGAIESLFDGEQVNHTEGRAALHTLLRVPSTVSLPTHLETLHREVLAERARCAAFVSEVHAGQRTGATGERFTDVLNIGIGGSDLGPAMAVEALRPFHLGRVSCHFISNVDGTQFADLADRLDPARTLVVVCSKTFTTQETLANANLVRAWLTEALGESAVPRHFAAVSTNSSAMDQFGIGADARFVMWDWVGGRYSMWSAIGLALELAVGSEHFEAFLAGGHAMDKHFRSAPLRDNLPVLLGLLAIWNRNGLGNASHAILPYTQRLARFPAYLQQLEMESLGKSVDAAGNPLQRSSGPVIFGEPGSNAQHSFFQLLHQGSGGVSMDFLLPVTPPAGDRGGSQLAMANCLAQMQALMAGQGPDAVRADLEKRGLDSEAARQLLPHKLHRGSRPMSLLAFRQLDPSTLGMLVALYEHKVFVQAALWGLNPFDQWGVELGKQLCNSLLPALKGEDGSALPAELAPLLGWMR
ncbi:MAG: glucose-6-phosphate isomerase [Steroidobacteraceae bacterium]